ncbi:bcl-2-like protein 15 [Fundulus diaphanus]
MAPNVESQTESLVFYLLADDGEIESRMLKSNVETDSVVEDTFDPVIVADKLRTIGDALNEDIRFKAAMRDLGEKVADEAFEATFSQGVETLCKSYVTRGPEVAPEMQLIKASVAFGLYVKNKSPHLKRKVSEAMTSFLNRHVATWVAQQGGWDKLPVSN